MRYALMHSAPWNAISPADVATRLRKGMSVEDIATELNRSPSWIAKLIRREGLVYTKPRRVWP